MARGLSGLMRAIQRAVARQSASENRDNRVKVWEHGPHRLLLTPEGGFFVVLLRPPPEAPGRDVPLLFSFRNLYLCGFLHEDGRWHVFSDADLGPGIDIVAHPSVHSLGYDGGYTGDVFKQVCIGVVDLFQTYLTLVDAGHPSDLFHSWGNRSKDVQDGGAAFEAPKHGFDSRDTPLRYSGVVLSKPPVLARQLPVGPVRRRRNRI